MTIEPNRVLTFRQFVDAEHQRLRGEYGCTWAEAREYRPDAHLRPEYLKMLHARDPATGPIPTRILDALTDIERADLVKHAPGLIPQGYAPPLIRRRSRAARPHATTGAQR
jgi:hypothetical protein